MARSCWGSGRDARDEPVGAYTQSALYVNDGSKTPLWVVDWCARVLLPSDGVHLIRAGPWASSAEDEAFGFFAKGRLLASYRVRDLVTFPSLLPHSVSHFSWRRSIVAEGGESVYPLAQLTFDAPPPLLAGRGHPTHVRVRTLQADDFVFDLGTGAIVSARRPVRLVLLVAAGVLTLAWVVRLRSVSQRPRAALRQRLAQSVEAAVASGWLLTTLGFVAVLVWVLAFVHRGMIQNPALEALWRLLLWLPYERLGDWLGLAVRLHPEGTGFLRAFGFWVVLSFLALVFDGLAIAAVARLRAGQPLPRASVGMPERPGRTIRRAAELAVTGTASVWLLGEAVGFGPPHPIVLILLVALTVIGPPMLWYWRRRGSASSST